MAQTLATVKRERESISLFTIKFVYSTTSIFTKINKKELNCTIKGVVDLESIFLNKINNYKDSIIQTYYRYA